VARARLLARRDGVQQAELLAREAVALSERGDSLVFQGDALALLGHVLAAAGRLEDAREAYLTALARYERKGARPLEAAARSALKRLAGNLAGPVTVRQRQ